MIKIILDEHDADRLLRILYNGTRPAHVHTLICSCGAIADLRVSKCAWNGWQILPHPRCPACLTAESASLVYAPSPDEARERFLQLVEKWNREGGDANQ